MQVREGLKKIKKISGNFHWGVGGWFSGGGQIPLKKNKKTCL